MFPDGWQNQLGGAGKPGTQQHPELPFDVPDECGSTGSPKERERDRQGELYLLGISKGLIPCRCCLDGRKEKGKAIEKK